VDRDECFSGAVWDAVQRSGLTLKEIGEALAAAWLASAFRSPQKTSPRSKPRDIAWYHPSAISIRNGLLMLPTVPYAAFPRQVNLLLVAT
jgi:hypothetical protein